MGSSSQCPALSGNSEGNACFVRNVKTLNMPSELQLPHNVPRNGV
jgi:hypothetical protein